MKTNVPARLPRGDVGRRDAGRPPPGGPASPASVLTGGRRRRARPPASLERRGPPPPSSRPGAGGAAGGPGEAGPEQPPGATAPLRVWAAGAGSGSGGGGGRRSVRALPRGAKRPSGHPGREGARGAEQTGGGAEGAGEAGPAPHPRPSRPSALVSPSPAGRPLPARGERSRRTSRGREGRRGPGRGWGRGRVARAGPRAAFRASGLTPQRASRRPGGAQPAAGSGARKLRNPRSPELRGNACNSTPGARGGGSGPGRGKERPLFGLVRRGPLPSPRCPVSSEVKVTCLGFPGARG